MDIEYGDDEKTTLLPSNGNVGPGNGTYDTISSPHENGTASALLPKTAEEFSIRRLSGRKKVVFIVIGMVNFSAFICFSLLAPFFPGEAKKKSASETTVGLIFSCFQLIIFITSPILGFFLTKIGAKFMFISGVFVCGCCSILFGVLDKCPPGDIFIAMCFLCRTIEALGTSMFITASFAIMAFEFPNHVATVFGALETFTGLGLMLGPPIGGALYELGGYGLPFWVLGSILITCGTVSLFLMPSPKGKCDWFRSNSERSVLSLLRSPLVVVTGLAIFSASYSLGFMDPTLASHLDKFELGSFYVGLIFLCTPGMYGLTAPLFGYIGDSKGWIGGMMMVGSISSALMFLLLGPAPFFPFIPYELWLIITTLLIFGITVGVAFVTSFKAILNGAKQLGYEESLDTFGMVSGLYNSAYSLGAFVGPTVGGIITDQYGFGWAACLSSLIFIFTVGYVF
ncbi:hypothetical protein LOTGIDRAFT_113544 [Lottia gigantea]|uniref:Major facilitator superfamily (MFS) profile domain-containing protein n=1 Tax=Lottia gigantea TaxID=225164 RepID=V4AQ94_LOTGI|nr:hypothetical protein LOTGIDRAFT_113544 [Lottia gigantea]ESO99372.1 hypothetical protein LOTGIDRAFT_113544 [Lottia gigantea]